MARIGKDQAGRHTKDSFGLHTHTPPDPPGLSWSYPCYPCNPWLKRATVARQDRAAAPFLTTAACKKHQSGKFSGGEGTRREDLRIAQKRFKFLTGGDIGTAQRIGLRRW